MDWRDPIGPVNQSKATGVHRKLHRNNSSTRYLGYRYDLVVPPEKPMRATLYRNRRAVTFNQGLANRQDFNCGGQEFNLALSVMRPSENARVAGHQGLVSQAPAGTASSVFARLRNEQCWAEPQRPQGQRSREIWILKPNRRFGVGHPPPPRTNAH